MASLMEIFLAMIFMIFGTLGIPSPLGVPPLPEDPAILRAAPKDAIAFMEWFGEAEPDPQSSNQTELLMAEPQVRALISKLEQATRGMIKGQLGEDADSSIEFFNLCLKIVRSPGCLYLSNVVTTELPAKFRAGLVAKVGIEATASVERGMRMVESILNEDGWRFHGPAHRAPATFSGHRFRALPFPKSGPPALWAVVDGYLVLAIGEGEAPAILARLRGMDGLNKNPRLAALRDEIGVERPAFRSWVDIEQILPLMLGMHGGEQQPADLQAEMERSFLGPLGLDKVTAILSESGLHGDGYSTRTQIACDGPLKGLLSLVGERPLSADELALIPGDASLAMAMRANPLEIFEKFLQTLELIEPRAVQELRAEFLDPLKQRTGLHFAEDLLAPLGNVVCLWNAPSDGGLVLTGATMAVTLKDPAKFATSFSKFMDEMYASAQPERRNRWGGLLRGTYLKKVSHGDHTIHFLNIVDEAGIAPAWCVTPKHLLFSAYPQTLKAVLDRGPFPASSLLQERRIAKVRASAISWIDVPSLFEKFWGGAHPFLQLMLSETQKEGFDFHLGDLPSAKAIAPHLLADLAQLRQNEHGILAERHGSLPNLDPILPMVLFGSVAFTAHTLSRAAPIPVMQVMELEVEVELDNPDKKDHDHKPPVLVPAKKKGG